MQMRRADRQVTDKNEIESIIKDCRVIRIATHDAHGPYIVPLNFGYEIKGETLHFYIHGAKSGRKVSAFENDALVAFELDAAKGLVSGGENPCAYGYAYSSIVGTAHVDPIDAPESKAHALNLIMRHQSGQEFDFIEAMMASVAVYEIKALEYSAKQRL